MRVAINGWFWNSPTTGSGQYTRWNSCLSRPFKYNTLGVI
jgi:hypothetical protein